VKLGLLPFLANSRVIYEVVRDVSGQTYCSKAGVKSVYSMSSGMLEPAYAPYPDEVWRLLPLSGYREPVYIRDAYYVSVDISGRFGDYPYVRVEDEPLKPFYSEPDDIVKMDGMELYKFRRDTVVRIMEYVNDKADRYGVWAPRFKFLFNEYLVDVNHNLSRLDSELSTQGIPVYRLCGYGLQGRAIR
jgi:hypothetical protein